MANLLIRVDWLMDWLISWSLNWSIGLLSNLFTSMLGDWVIVREWLRSLNWPRPDDWYSFHWPAESIRYRQPCQVLLEFGYSGYRGLPILKGNEILIIIHTAVITVDLITVERATSHSDYDHNFYLKVLPSFFRQKNTQRIKHICAY